MEGKKIHLVEMRDELAPDANVRHRPLLLKEIEKYVTVRTGYRGLEVREDGITDDEILEECEFDFRYQYDVNTRSDASFIKEYLEDAEVSEETSFLITDGAYTGEEASRLAADIG